MKKQTIITSVLLVFLCISLIAGSTYALFTSESKVNIAVTSGKVDVKASLTINSIYSAVGDTNGTLLDEYNNKYSHEEQTASINGKHLFKNGGTAYLDTQGVLNLDRITPGDKVNVTLNITNDSNIVAKYRIKVEVPEAGKKLAEALTTTISGTQYAGLSKYRGIWETITVGLNPIYGFSIEMPMDVGNAYQDLSTGIVITVEAVQGNAVTENETIIETFNSKTSSKTTSLDNNGSAVIVSNVTVAENDTDNTTKVELTHVGTSDQNVRLDVKTSDFMTTYDSGYKILGNTYNNVVGSIDLRLVSGTTLIDTFDTGIAKITTHIVKGLTNVQIVYNGDASKTFGTSAGCTPVGSESEVNLSGKYYYDPSTGKLVFATNHFSEYAVTSTDSLEALIPELSQVFSSLVDAFNECRYGDTIELIKDVTLTTNIYPTKAVTLTGKSISFAPEQGIGVTYPLWFETEQGKSVVLKDITINGSGYNYSLGIEQGTSVLENVNINSVANTGFCQEEGEATLGNVKIHNSGNHTQSWRDTALSTAMGAKITVNSGEYYSENGYAIYVFTSGGTVEVNDGSFKGKICANIDRNTYKDKEAHIIINGGTFTDVEFSVIGGDQYASIEIRGGKFDSDPSTYVDTSAYTVTNNSGVWEVSIISSN